MAPLSKPTSALFLTRKPSPPSLLLSRPSATPLSSATTRSASRRPLFAVTTFSPTIRRQTTLFSFVASLLLVGLSLVAGGSAAAEEEGSSITCATGWGSNGGQQQLILPEQINDGYCDCPIDGKDEPNTQACSGSNTWPGSIITTDETNDDDTADADGAAAPPTTFKCPQQPGMDLPLSRVNDGICDCCDGADENNNNNNEEESSPPCPDNCEEILRAQREKLEAALKSFTEGSTKRIAELNNFQQIRAEKLQEVQGLEDTLSNLDQTETIESELDALKQGYMMQRMATMKGEIMTKSGISDIILGAFNDDDNDENLSEQLQSFIIHACQIDGEISEIENDDSDSNTCVALRLAGLDMGITWSDDNYNRRTPILKRNDNPKELATILFDNASQQTSPECTRKAKADFLGFPIWKSF